MFTRTKEWDNLFKNFDKDFERLNNMFTSVSYVLENKLGEVVDVASEDQKAYHFEVEAAGFKKDELDISLNGKVITVKGKSAKTGRSINTYFSAPKSLNPQGITAKFENGLLEITAEKSTDNDGVKISIS